MSIILLSNSFTSKNVKFSAGNETVNKKSNENSKNSNSYRTIISDEDRTEELIKNLQKRIETIQNNDKFSINQKRDKIEAINEQIEEIQSMEKQRKIEEAAKALSADNRSEEEKVADRKKQANKNATYQKNQDSVDLSISQESMEMLVNAEIGFDRIRETNILKAEKERDIVRTRHEKESDNEIQSGISANTMSFEATKIVRRIIDDFDEEHKGMEYSEKYYDHEIGKRIKAAITDPDFKQQFAINKDAKDELIAKLEEVVNKLEGDVRKTIAEINESAELAAEAEADKAAMDSKKAESDAMVAANDEIAQSKADNQANIIVKDVTNGQRTVPSVQNSLSTVDISI